ncbi:hypothetical protein pb186bvf_018562 [Paramecium bursaria]
MLQQFSFQQISVYFCNYFLLVQLIYRYKKLSSIINKKFYNLIFLDKNNQKRTKTI